MKGIGNILAELAVVIRGDTTKLDGDLKEAEQKAKASQDRMNKGFMVAGGVMTGIGAAIVGSTVAGVKSFAETADAIDEMSQRTGLSIKTIQEMKYAAGQTGGSIEGLEVASKRMAVSVDAFRQGGKEATETYDRLGLTLGDLEGLSLDDTMYRIGQAVSMIEDPIERTKLAVAIFGKSGTDMIPLFADFERLRKEANDTGAVLDDLSIQKGGKLADSMKKLEDSFGGLANALASLLTDNMQQIIDDITKVVVAVSDWAKANPEVASGILQVVVGIGLLFAALGPLLMMMPGIIAFFGLFAAGGAAAGIGAAFVAALPLIAAFAAAILAVIFLVTQLIGLFNALKDASKPIAQVSAQGKALAARAQAEGKVSYDAQGRPTYAFASGGIVNSPTMGLLGEAGPEAVVPLDRLGGMGGNSVTVNVGNYMGDEISKRALVRDIKRILDEEDRRRQYQPTKTSYYSAGGHL